MTRNRCRLLITPPFLKADEGEGQAAWTDAKIAEAFGVGVRTVERTRRLLVVEGFEAVLVRKPSPNRQYRKLDGAQEAALVKLACSKPPAGRVLDLATPGRSARGTRGRDRDRARGGAHDAPKNDLKPWLREHWVLPPTCDAEFVCAMEDVLEVYPRPYDPKRPQVCFDEQSKQLIRETRAPIPGSPGRPARADYEYERNGTINLFMMFEPLAGRRRVKVTDRRTKVDFAHVIRELVDDQYPEAEKVVRVMDNLNTHEVSSLYEAFAPEEARRLIGRLEVHYTPKHGSWLNMAETEWSALSTQCLDRRLGEKSELQSEVAAWERHRNTVKCRVDWQFTTKDARVKLKRLYPTIQTG